MNLDVLAIVPFGYPAEPKQGGKKNRTPLGEVVSHEHWGMPFEER